MAATIELQLNKDEWELLRSIVREYDLSMTKTCNKLIRLGIYTYKLNKNILDEI